MNKFLSLILLACTLTSCFSRYCHVATNTFVDSRALQAGFPAESRFFLDAAPRDNPLFSLEVGEKIENLLNEKGYQVCEEKENADYILTFDFDQSSFSEIVKVPLHIPGQKETTQGHIHEHHGSCTNYSETKESSGTTVYVPENRTFFKRTLSLIVYAASTPTPTSRPLWSAEAESTGSSEDLREIIDPLLDSAMDHFGKSSGACVHTSFKLKD